MCMCARGLSVSGKALKIWLIALMLDKAGATSLRNLLLCFF